MGQILDLGWGSFFCIFLVTVNEICWTNWVHEPASCGEYCFMHIFILLDMWLACITEGFL